MKGFHEVQVAPDPAAAAEIALIRIIYAADLPTPDEALRRLKNAGNAPPRSEPASPSGGGAARPVARAAEVGGGYREAAPAPAIAPAQMEGRPQARFDTFEQVVALAGKHRDVKLKVELESFVRIISYAHGRIELALADNAPPDLAGRLLQRLKEWTGENWSVTVNTEKNGATTIRDARLSQVMAHPLVEKAFATFPDAEIMAIKDIRLEEGVDAADMADDDNDDDDISE